MIPRFHRAVCDYFTLRAAPDLGPIRKPSESFRMTVMGQIRSFGDVGSMSGLPESGHGRAIYEYAT